MPPDSCATWKILNFGLWRCFALPVLSSYTGSCSALLVQMGTHCMGSAGKRVGSGKTEYTDLCMWCWQQCSALEIPHLSPCPSPHRVSYKRDFPLRINEWQSFRTVLQPCVFANPKNLTFKQQGRANSANRSTTLSQWGFLFKANEMLTRWRVKWGRSEYWCLFCCCYVNNFRLELHSCFSTKVSLTQYHSCWGKKQIKEVNC